MAEANVRRRDMGSPEPTESIHERLPVFQRPATDTRSSRHGAAACPLSPTSDNVSYVRFGTNSFRAIFSAT